MIRSAFCSEDLVQEMHHITMARNANLGRKQFGALELLNAITDYGLESTFPILSVSLMMFLTAPVRIASVQ